VPVGEVLPGTLEDDEEPETDGLYGDVMPGLEMSEPEPVELEPEPDEDEEPEPELEPPAEPPEPPEPEPEPELCAIIGTASKARPPSRRVVK